MNDIKNNTDKIESIYCLDSDIEATQRLDSVLDDIKKNQYCLGLYPRILSNLFILIVIMTVILMMLRSTSSIFACCYRLLQKNAG